MKICFTAIMVIAAFFLGTVTYAQSPKDTLNEFAISGQFRPRFEFRDGYLRPLAKTEKPAAMIASRLRFNLDYSYSDRLTTRFSYQDISLWGQSGPVQGLSQSNHSFGIFEGWVDLKIYKQWRVKIGKQTIALDDERLFGLSDWAPGARSHDALSVYYGAKRFKFSSFFAFNQNYAALYQDNLNNPSGSLYSPEGAQPYKLMQTLWMEYKASEASKFSFLFANIGYQKATAAGESVPVRYLQTAGGNYFLNGTPVSGSITGYYQFGKNIQGEKTSAYLLSGKIRGRIHPKLSGTLGADYLSGSSHDSDAETNHAFQTLFGTNHKFYGNMDYFFSGNVPGTAGLLNTYLGGDYHPSTRMDLNLTGHLFYAASDFYANQSRASKNLGQEIDLSILLKINSFSEISAGYSAYFTTTTIQLMKHVADAGKYQGWCWLSLNVHPEFFKARF